MTGSFPFSIHPRTPRGRELNVNEHPVFALFFCFPSSAFSVLRSGTVSGNCERKYTHQAPPSYMDNRRGSIGSTGWTFSTGSFSKDRVFYRINALDGINSKERSTQVRRKSHGFSSLSCTLSISLSRARDYRNDNGRDSRYVRIITRIFVSTIGSCRFNLDTPR